MFKEDIFPYKNHTSSETPLHSDASFNKLFPPSNTQYTSDDPFPDIPQNPTTNTLSISHTPTQSPHGHYTSDSTVSTSPNFVSHLDGPPSPHSPPNSPNPPAYPDLPPARKSQRITTKPTWFKDFVLAAQQIHTDNTCYCYC